MDNSYLAHHGVLGMKWGVRRYQNKDGSLTSAGRKRYGVSTNKTESGIDTNKTKKLLSRDYDSIKKRDEKYAEFLKKVSELDYPTGMDYWDTHGSNNQNDWTRSERAKKYSEEYDKLYNKYSEFASKMGKEKEKEESELIKDVFFNKEVKKEVENARKTYKELEQLRRDTINDDSPYMYKAYKQYLKDYNLKDTEDNQYGFEHEEWGEWSKYYKEAQKAYNTKSKELQKKYDDQITNIGKKICGDLANADVKVYGFKMKYIDAGKEETETIIRHYDEYLTKFK